MTETFSSPPTSEETTEFICGREYSAISWTPAPREEIPNRYVPGPYECRTCFGTGIIAYTENMAPDGEGYWPMTIYVDCPACLQRGLCPKCGQQTINDDWNCTACDYRGPLEG
jgi:hypothetical protein